MAAKKYWNFGVSERVYKVRVVAYVFPQDVTHDHVNHVSHTHLPPYHPHRHLALAFVHKYSRVQKGGAKEIVLVNFKYFYLVYKVICQYT